MGVLLEAKELGKSYAIGPNEEQHVLKKVSLQIRKGEFIAVMGPSGSGKSTLLFHLSGMDRASSGSVTFNGEEISSLSEKRLAELRLTKMGFIFQHIHLLKNLNLFDNIVLSAYLAKRSSRKAVNARALEDMKRSGIAELADKSVTQASGGQLQRAAICRALINRPDIVFGDEPTGALNSRSAGEIMDLLAEINREGTTILLVTHDVKVAAKTDRVLFMLDGSLVAERQLGKYRKENNDGKEREERLAGWLAGLGL
ncbi:ABC transporter ATP-binding protein [Cohnella cellulosilytica]|uniref:ABC transporter ATP-binding protein n=1 Tax=Cohnella cellulosilytica TaxID=986710 RepID=A0ABW2F8F1_9BACL